jgi:tetratricopeptide (TPR) repeat protein
VRNRTRRAPPEPAAPRARRLPVFAALVIAAVLWTYAPGLDGAFLLDDFRAVVRNTTIETLSGAFSPPPESTVSGRPVANLSFALNRWLAAPDSLAWSYHAGNLLIHLAAALLLMGVVRRTLESDRLRPRFGESAGWIACAVAVLWAVHPLNTEAVTYVVQRVESLMSLFLLLTLYCAIRADGAAGSWRTAWTAAAVLACALGMGTKEVMAGAPLVVLAWDWLFLAPRRPRWGLAAGLAATWIVLGLLVYNERRAPSVDLGGPVVWRYLLTQSAVITRYLRLVFAPDDLVFLYSWPLVTSAGAVLAPAALVCTLLALTVWGLLKRHPAAFAGVVFFVVLAPTSSVLPIVTEVAAEHRMYLPLAAIVALVVPLLLYVSIRVTRTHRAGVAVAGVVALAAAIALGLETRDRNRVYADDELMWADTVAKQPSNARARVAYGSILATKRKVPEAAVQFEAATALDDQDPIAHARLGSALAAQGRFDEAIAHLDRALARRPTDVEAHRTLGQIYAMRQDDAKALPHLLAAAEAIPDPGLVTRIAAMLAESPNPMVRDPRRALAFAEQAAAMTGRRDPAALAVLSAALAGVGRLTEAATVAREAAPLAAGQGDQPLASELERRARAYGGG